jgi:hypothetical protein
MKKIITENIAYLFLVIFAYLLIHNEWRYKKNLTNLSLYHSRQIKNLQLGHTYNIRSIDSLSKQITQLQIEASVLADEYREIKGSGSDVNKVLP